MGLEGLIRRDPQGFERHAHLRFARREGIEVHRDEDGVRPVEAALAVAEDVLVGALVEDEVPVLVERPVLPADPVDAGDVVADVAGCVPVARLDLVLLGVQVLLRARDGGVLAELVAAVDPVDGREGRRQHEPHPERGRPRLLEDRRQDVGRVREEVPAEVLRHLAACQLREVVDQLLLEVPPREVRVGLGEADLREGLDHPRPREGLGEEDHVGVNGLDLRDHPGPERDRLGVRIVDAEDPDALARSRRAGSPSPPPRAPRARGCRSSRG